MHSSAAYRVRQTKSTVVGIDCRLPSTKHPTSKAASAQETRGFHVLHRTVSPCKLMNGFGNMILHEPASRPLDLFSHHGNRYAKHVPLLRKNVNVGFEQQLQHMRAEVTFQGRPSECSRSTAAVLSVRNSVVAPSEKGSTPAVSAAHTILARPEPPNTPANSSKPRESRSPPAIRFGAACSG